MFCNQCGEENRNDRKFCTNCGQPLRDYTKPRENLIMPEEIEEKQKVVHRKNNLSKIFSLILLGLQLIVVALLVVSFLVKEPADIICLIVGLGVEFISVVLLIVKNRLIKKANQKLENK